MKRRAESSRSPALLAVDVVMLAACQIIAMSPLADAYASRRWLLAAAAGFVIGVVAVQLGILLRWGALRSALLLALGYLVAGPLVAGVGFGRELITGVVDAWRTALTMPVPLGDDFGALIVPLLIALLGTSAVAALLWRSRWPSLAAIAVIVTFACSAAFGVRAAEFSLLRGVVLSVVLLVWIRWRAMRGVRSSWLRRVSLSAAVVVVAGLLAGGLTVVSRDSDARVVARDHIEPPLQQLEFKSPLARFRDYYKNHKEEALFKVEGAPEGARVVLATMDTFDGLVWNVSTTDRKSGTSAFVRAPAASRADAVTVTIDALTGPWVPTVGLADAATREGKGDDRLLLMNVSTGGVAEFGDVRKGDRFSVDWTLRESGKPDSTANADQSAQRPPVPVRIEALDKLVERWLAEDGPISDFERATTIAEHFSTEGYFSDGLEGQVNSPSGHGARRVADLVADPIRMVGNDEQYASAMAIALQSLGMPARVVLGFKKLGANGTVVGDDVSSWVEVKFSHIGWVAFSPTPPEDRNKPPAIHDTPNPAPQPNVVQPPLVPQEPAAIQGQAPEGAGKSLGARIWDIILMILGVVWRVVTWLLWLAPLWLILGFKWLRRRQRRSAVDPINRVSGGWREVTDGARDLGTRLPEGQTRAENSGVLAARFPESGASALAAVADRHVFGPGSPTDHEVVAYWADVDTALARMRRSAPRWRRVLGWISPMSIPWGAVRRLLGNQAERAKSFDVRAVRVPTMRRKAK